MTTSAQIPFETPDIKRLHMHLIQSRKANAATALHGHQLDDVAVAHKSLKGDPRAKAKSGANGVLQHTALTIRALCGKNDQHKG